MTLSPLDWIIVAVYMAGCIIAGIWMRRYVRGVDDFAVAGREMDVNLGVASLAATEVGIVTIMYTAQMGFTNGLAGATPGVLIALAMFLVGVTGFVIGPMRDAGVMTIPELFEKRFGKHVRWLAGLVVILGGLLNMGIFLRVGGEFLMHVTGFDPKDHFTLSLAGYPLELGYLEIMMTALLAVILLYTALGGMLSVLITDYLQFLVMGLGIVVVSVLVLWNVGWSNLLTGLSEAHRVCSAATLANDSAAEAEQAAAAAMAAAKGPNTGKNKPPTTGNDKQAPATAPRATATAEKAILAAGEARMATSLRHGKTKNALSEEEIKLLAEIAQARTKEAEAAREKVAEATRAAAQEAQSAARKARAAAQKALAAREKAKTLREQARVLALKVELADEVAQRAAATSAGDQGALPELAKTTAAKAGQLHQKAEQTKIKAEQAAATLATTAAGAEKASREAAAAARRARQAAAELKRASGGLAIRNPFNPMGFSGIGWGWVVWQALTAIAVVTTWQTTIARVLAARDSKSAKRMYRKTSFFFVGRFALPGLWGAAAFLYFWSHGGLPGGVTDLTAMPTFLEMILPVGVIGIVIAAMLAAEMSTDSGYMLTWATVIYNDLISPCLSKPLSPKAKLLTVRMMVLAIGAFLVFYGLWYELPGGAWDYLAITGNIYLASLFTLLASALYWRGANSWGAIAAIVLGATGPLAYVFVNAIIDKAGLDPSWKIPAEVSGFAAFGLAFGGMIFGSLLGRVMGVDQKPPATAEETP